MKQAIIYQMKPELTDLHKKFSKIRVRRKFTQLHSIISHYKMPAHEPGYIRPRKHEHY